MDFAKEGATALSELNKSDYAQFRKLVLSPLRGIGRRVKIHALLIGLATTIAILVCAILIHLLLDKLLVLGIGPRLVLLILLAGLCGRPPYLFLLRPIGLRAGAEQMA